MDMFTFKGNLRRPKTIVVEVRRKKVIKRDGKICCRSREEVVEHTTCSPDSWTKPRTAFAKAGELLDKHPVAADAFSYALHRRNDHSTGEPTWKFWNSVLEELRARRAGNSMRNGRSHAMAPLDQMWKGRR